MGAAGLEEGGEFGGLGAEGFFEEGEGVEEEGGVAEEGDLGAGGEAVVGGLAHVDVVVGMDGGLGAAGAAEGFVGEVGEDLVEVHVGGGAGAGLEEVDGEFAVMGAGEDGAGGVGDGAGFGVGEEAEAGVGQGAGEFEEGHAVDDFDGQGRAGEAEVLDGAGGLGAVEGVSGDVAGAEGVVFDAGGGGGRHGGRSIAGGRGGLQFRIRRGVAGRGEGFSTVWKKVFHGVEKSEAFFPYCGKHFSMEWKNGGQGLRAAARKAV